MKKVFVQALLIGCTLAAHAQLIPYPFGFYPYEKTDLATNKVQRVYQYIISGDEGSDAGYLPDDSLYSGLFNVHASGWIIDKIEKDVNYDEGYFSGSLSYVYAGPNGLVSRMDYIGADGYGHKVVYQYEKGILSNRAVVAIDPTEEVFTSSKGRIVSSKLFRSYPTYDEDGNFVEGHKMLVGREEYTYDAKGNLSQIKSYYYQMEDDTDENAIVAVQRRKYTPDGRLSKIENFNVFQGTEEPTDTFEFKYNDKKLLVERKMTNAFDEWPTYYRYVYVTGN